MCLILTSALQVQKNSTFSLRCHEIVVARLLVNFMILYFPDMVAVDEALCHPFLSSLHDINDEPICRSPFIFDFEHPSFSEENIKELIWRESLKFNPDS